MKGLLVRVVYGTDESLTTIQKARKGFVFTLVVAWFAIVIDLAIVLILNPVSWNLIGNKFGNVILAFGLPWGLVRAYQEKSGVTDVTMLFLIYVITATLYVGLFTAALRSSIPYCILVLNLLATSHIKNWHRHALAICPIMFGTIYNTTFGVHGYPTAQIVTPENSLSYDLSHQVRMIVFIPLALIGIHAQGKAYDESVNKLQSAVSVAKEVSENLTEYNTKAAEQTLQRYSSTTECDQDLHGVLLVIVENLKKYKPFLPNYIVPQQQEESDRQSKLHPPPPRNGSSSEDGSISMIDSSSENNTKNFDDPTSPPTTIVVSTSPSFSEKTIRLLAMIPTQRTVSYGLLDLNIHSDDIIDNPQTLRIFIDRLYRYADITKAAVHSCLGDTVHITWNAVHAVPSPDVSAVGAIKYLTNTTLVSASSGMALTMNTSSDNLSSLSSAASRVEINSSVMTGVGECRMTGTVHQTFLLHIEWRDAQQALHRYAQHVKTNVVCERTAKGVSEATMLVDRLFSATEHVNVYELFLSVETRRRYQEVARAVVEMLGSKTGLNHHDDVLTAFASVIEEEQKTSPTAQALRSMQHLHAKVMFHLHLAHVESFHALLSKVVF